MNTNDRDDIGVVFRKTLGHYTVHTNGREIDCVLSSMIHKQLIYPTADPSSLRQKVQAVREIDHADPIAIGDRVRYMGTGDGRGLITEILPRRSKLSRPAAVPGQRVFEQVIVSNADLVLPVFSTASPTPKWGLLDRYLVAAEAAGLPSLIVITKLDLAGKNPDLDTDLEIYRRIGYSIQLVCSITGEGIEELKAALQGKHVRAGGKIRRGKNLVVECHPTRAWAACQSGQFRRNGQRLPYHLASGDVQSGLRRYAGRYTRNA